MHPAVKKLDKAEKCVYNQCIIIRSSLKMSFEKAKAHLEKYGLENKIKLFDVSSATVALAAVALGTEEAKIAKTLSFMTPDGVVLVVCAGDTKVNNKKYKSTFEAKAKMLAHEEVESLVGHGVGGVCPFGVNSNIKIYLDESLRRFEMVYPAAGTANSAVELTLLELERASEALGWIDVTDVRES